MSEVMRPIPFGKMMDWALAEYESQNAIFGVRKDKFYKNTSGKMMELFGEKIASPVGPAAGPNSQLAQNILAAYLAGSRFVELKTVQKMDGAELSACVPRPCINAEDECYNVEWSTELTVPQAFDEYVKAWFAIRVLAKELGISDRKDFAYNMSVGYDLEGIKGEKIDRYIEGMKDASSTQVWGECTGWLRENIDRFQNVTMADVEAYESRVCSSITLSTLHGCPPEEIERIARYLLEEKGVHTYVKCNPTLLGYQFARDLLDSMGYGYITFDDHHFNNDLQYGDAVAMFRRLRAFAAEKNLAFGVKITNTFPVQIKRNELPGEEMYMSGRSLYPLSLSVAARLSKDFDGELPISYSGGADAFNIRELFQLGVQPITVATTILKPGGYERLKQLATELEPLIGSAGKIDAAALEKLAAHVAENENHRKEKREVASRKTDSALPLFDCFKAPCSEGGCPINQQIPQYLKEVGDGNYGRAFDIIAIDNALPSLTGAICNHPCQTKCTRLDYDSSLEIRGAKRMAANHAQKAYIDGLTPPPLRTKKRAVVVGAGPAGVAVALFLRRNGVGVTVLEKREEPLGIVKYVIPGFRISSEEMERDYQMSRAMGVEYVFGVDEKIDVQALKEEYDFVILATGAWKEGASPVKEGYENMRDALEFLLESKKNDCKVELGASVAVIGGGDVAMDCARAAKRAPGVEKVVVVYRRTMDFMPAEPEEIRLAKEDGVEFMELLGPASCNAKTLVCEKMVLTEWDETGRRGIASSGD
ncbi:MAG: putative selenate reductase subunit YgfK [Oscillospiraceae bacterium]